MKDNLDEAIKMAEAFKQKHQSSNKASVHALMSEMETLDKLNFKSEQHAQWQDMFDCVNDSMVICYPTFAPFTTVHDYLHIITTAPHCQPVCKQASTDESKQTNPMYNHPQALKKTIHISIPKKCLMVDKKILAPRLPIPRSQHDQLAISKMICMFPDCVVQGDFGANRAVANDSTLLMEFTPINPFLIGTIGPKPIIATHRDIMKLPTIEGLYEGFTTYCSKDASGSVISPDRRTRHVSESKG